MTRHLPELTAANPLEKTARRNTMGCAVEVGDENAPWQFLLDLCVFEGKLRNLITGKQVVVAPIVR